MSCGVWENAWTNFFTRRKWCGFRDLRLHGSKKVTGIQKKSSQGHKQSKEKQGEVAKKREWALTSDMKEMEELTTKFFRELYANPDVQPDQVIDLFQPLITKDMNASLCKAFSEEISNTLFQIGPMKALGPDFSAHVFQRNWEVLRADVIASM
jgi:23S rRNA G2069 N7-methylase RlmK/C1962 C5-methylase RlmI